MRIGNIHEIPVVKNGIFMGIIANGESKPEREWYNIRRDNKWMRYGIIKWRRLEIDKLLSQIRTTIYIYPILNLKKLKWSDEDWKKYKKKRHYPNGMAGLAEMTEKEKKEFFAENYSDEYVNEFIEDGSRVKAVSNNGVVKIQDMSSRYYNFCNGYRKVNKIEEGNKNIYFLGPCTILGSLVSDEHTIEYYLYEILVDHNIQGYNILNCGMSGTFGRLDRLFTEKLSDRDIVIYLSQLWEYKIWQDYSIQNQNVHMGSDLTQAYNGIDNPAGNIVNDLYHCNHVINKRMAGIIFDDIECELKTEFNAEINAKQIQDYYISWDIVQYYKEYVYKYNIQLSAGNTGAVVMNCNPFTKGHRYLIEYACLRVDKLYVFVVQEDESQFSFEDRFNMVKNGVADLDKVSVLPSGEYIISKETFGQYFKKENITDIQSMDYDVHIFAEVIAKEFGINVRFVGEEPFDAVTAKYNETMKRILPQSGIDVVEVPRLKNEAEEIISASLVRKYLAEHKYDKMDSYLPESTITYLKNKI